MPELPFETGPLSLMSDAELYDLAADLEMRDHWRFEEQVKRAVDMYMNHYWSESIRGGPVQQAMSMRGLAETLRSGAVPPVTKRSRSICLNVPPGIDERTARLFAEIQFREQANPGWDPTEYE